MNQLLADLSSCEELDDLVLTTGEQLDRLLRPESCVIFTRGDGTFAPVLRGDANIPVYLRRGDLGPMAFGVPGRPGEIDIGPSPSGRRGEPT